MSGLRGVDQRLPVLYVGGMPRSGSTLTDLMLHQLSGHVGVGELFYLWRNCIVHDNLCACGKPFSACDFWLRVGKEAFGGWDRLDPYEVMRLQDTVDRTAAIPMLLSPRRPPRFQRALDDYVDVLTRLYQAIALVSGAEVIVDSSKRPSLAFVLRLAPELDLRVAHVVRDPRGVAFSFAKHVALDPGVALRQEMPRSTTRKVSRRWLSVNALIGSLRRLGVPSVRLRYEDLVAAPGDQLSRILAMEGRAEHEFEFVTAGDLQVPESHLIAAGRIRLSSGRVALHLDEDWRSQMSPGARKLVEVMTAPARWRYGYR